MLTKGGQPKKEAKKEREAINARPRPAKEKPRKPKGLIVLALNFMNSGSAK